MSGTYQQFSHTNLRLNREVGTGENFSSDPDRSLGVICRSDLFLRPSSELPFQVDVESGPDEAFEISSSNSSDEVE